MDGIPPAKDTDPEDVVWGLQTAEALWKRHERIDAIVWLRRAAQAAGDADDDDRALTLARAAAELTEWLVAGAQSAPPPPVTAEIDDLLSRSSGAIQVAMPVDLDETSPSPLPAFPLSEQTERPGPPEDAPKAEIATALYEEAAPAPRQDPDETSRMALGPVVHPSSASVRTASQAHTGMLDPWAEPPASPVRPVDDDRTDPPPPAPEQAPEHDASAAAPHVAEEDQVDDEEEIVTSARPLSARMPPPRGASSRPPPPVVQHDEHEAPTKPYQAFDESPTRPKSVPVSGRAAEAPLPPKRNASVPAAPPHVDAVRPPGPSSPSLFDADDLPPPPSKKPRPASAAPPVPSAPPARSALPARSAPPAAPAPPAPPASPALDLSEVEAFSDLPDDARDSFALAAKLETLARDEEISSFALAFVIEGQMDVTAAIVDAPAVRLETGAVLRSRGTTDEVVPVRLVCASDAAKVATWSDAAVIAAFTSCPWVEDDLRAAADRVQTLVGVTMGPLGERLDKSLREQVTDRLSVRVLAQGEIVVSAGQPVPGLFIVGVGELELLAGDVVERVVGSGEFLFPEEVLQSGPAKRTARAGKGGTAVMFGDRRLAQELLVTCPSLLEIFAGM